MEKKSILEIVCFNPDSAIVAQNAGADRIELCADLKANGIWPGEDSVVFVRKNVRIGLFVMIRPRGGDFCYSEDEFELMKTEIDFCKKQQCDGVVFGILDKNRKVDKKRNTELVRFAQPLPCTFHRAFDQTENLFESMETVIGCGFTRILTSGGKDNPVAGADMLKKLVNASKGRIIILPGGGVRSENISELKAIAGVTEFHSSSLIDGVDMANENEIRKMKRVISL